MMFPRIDPVEELRLRRWARENYVASKLRRPEWHPVILDEMLAKDDEIRAERSRSTREGHSDSGQRPRKYFVLHGSHISLSDRSANSSESQTR